MNIYLNTSLIKEKFYLEIYSKIAIVPDDDLSKQVVEVLQKCLLSSQNVELMPV